jgi:hypothetical protein
MKEFKRAPTISLAFVSSHLPSPYEGRQAGTSVSGIGNIPRTHKTNETKFAEVMLQLPRRLLLSSVLWMLVTTPTSLAISRDDTGEPWMTLRDGTTQFQPAKKNPSPLAQDHLRQLTTSDATTSSDERAHSKIFADGAKTYYDEYAQAWRALGFYIDCDYYDEDDGGNTGCQRFLCGPP